MTRTRSLRATPAADLTPFSDDGELVTVDVGPDFRIYGVVALEEIDYRTEEAGGVSFAKTVPDSPQSYRVFALHDGIPTLDVTIDHEPYNIHEVQPLPNEELLLVCGRSRYRGPDDHDKNGRIYSTDGRPVREILLGDGILGVQTTPAGTIWTSFFDEGVLGNFGWKDPIGSSGLIEWDSQGNRLYEFRPADGLEAICDCYALNVESDSSTWLYYYTEFPLVHLRNRKIESHWSIPVEGSHVFAVSRGYALFDGGYDDPDLYYLFELSPGGKVREVAKLELTDEHGQPLVAESSFARADTLYVVCDDTVYRVDIRMAVDA